MNNCPDCNGYGTSRDSLEDCATCDGSGRVYLDALDCETVTLKAARLVQRENDTVCGAQQTYYEDEA